MAYRPSPRRPLRPEKSPSLSPLIRRRQNETQRERIPSSGEESSDSDEYLTDVSNTASDGFGNFQTSSTIEEQDSSYTEERYDSSAILREASRSRSLSRRNDGMYRTRTLANSRICANPQHHTVLKDSWAWLLIGALIIIAGYFMISSEGSKSIPVDLRKNCSFDLLKKEFPNEENDLWKSLKVGTESILNNDPAVPGVYLFLHSKSSLPQLLIRKIAKTAATCFSPSLEPIELGRNDFTSEETIRDYGVIIEKYKNNIKDGGALIVANLNEIPGKAARALHAICDIHSPIVRKVVIFMTLVAPTEEGNPIEIAENTLFDLWGSSIKRSELDPLITRVTDQVFQLKSK